MASLWRFVTDTAKLCWRITPNRATLRAVGTHYTKSNNTKSIRYILRIVKSPIMCRTAPDSPLCNVATSLRHLALKHKTP